MWRRSRRQRERLTKLSGWSAALLGFAAPFSAGDVKALQGRLVGEVVLPSDNAYAGARQLSNLAFQHFPQLIAYCEVFQDVHECLAFAHKHQRQVTTRSGGHSTAGFSSNDGMVIDTSRLNAVYIDPAAKTAVVGPGTNWEHLNATIADYHLHMPTGVCGDVCVAGFVQGGGFGLTSRKWGMNCDSVLSMLVMLADGRIVRASADCNADLYWAMRGGTGNNFGILLQVTYRVHELPTLWGWGLRWPLAKAAAAMVAMQAGYMGGKNAAPGELGYMGAFLYDGDPLKPSLIMRGLYWGSRAEGLKLLRPLIEDTGATLEIDQSGSYNELNDSLFEGVPNCPDLAREDKQSIIVARRLKQKDWQKVCDFFETTPNPWSCIAIEPYGGQINAVKRDATAFIHRDADMDLFVDVFWMNEPERVAIEAWLDRFMVMLDGYGNGQSYQNYPRLSQTDYRERYWADQFDKLLRIKCKYDPDNFFRYAQSVSPEKGENWPKPAPGPIVAEPWSPKPITEE